mmetsp:Transcript_42194/g.68000  ORF Transcript_42194/g.68000 Transcript_42194/m.68000 type:complete len:176 (+) Transcript_42194:39-566(+)
MAESSSSGPKFGRRKGNQGWGGGTETTTKTGTGAAGFSFTDEATPASNEGKRPKFKETNITDIQEIPDMEANQEHDIKMQVAAAPNVRQRVQSLKELDHDIMYQLPNTLQDGVDMSLLTATLVPQSKTLEEDEPWTFDQLFTSLSSQMRKEQEEKAETESKDKSNKGAILKSMRS